MRRLLTAVLLVLVLSAVLAAPAFAQSPVQQGYGGEGGGSLGDVRGGAQGGTLPFTGIDLALLVAGGLTLTAVGAALVRAGTRTGTRN
jgi:hypothetical protein